MAPSTYHASGAAGSATFTAGSDHAAIRRARRDLGRLDRLSRDSRGGRTTRVAIPRHARGERTTP